MMLTVLEMAEWHESVRCLTHSGSENHSPKASQEAITSAWYLEVPCISTPKETLQYLV